MNLIEVFNYISLYLFIFFSKYKINTSTISSILLGVGTGVIANVMFVLTTTTNYHMINLGVSFLFAIILLLIGSLEKKDK